MFKLIMAIGAIQVAAIIVSLVRSKTIAVLLGPQGVGVVSVIDQFAQLVAQISAFGLPVAAVKFLSRSHSKSHAAFTATYSSLLRVLLLVTAGGAVISLTVLLWRPGWLGGELSTYHRFLLPALIGVPLMALLGFFGNVLAAAQQPRISALMVLLIAIGSAMSAFIGVIVGGIGGLYWGNLAANLIVAGLVFLYLNKRLGLSPFDPSASIRGEIQANRDVIGFSLILYMTSFTYSLSYFVVRYTVLAARGETGAGLLHAAIALSGALYLVLGPATGLYLTPILNRDIPTSEKLQATFNFQAKFMVITGALAMPMVLFPQWLLTLLFSPAFAEVGRVVFVFVLAQYIGQLNGVNQSLLIGMDDLGVYGAIVASGQLATGVFAWFLAPAYGVLGAGLALLLSSIFILVLTMARLMLKHRTVMPADLRLLFGYGLLALFVAGAISDPRPTLSPVVLLTKVGIYLLFMVGFLMFAAEADRASLLQGLRRLKARFV